MSQVQAHPSKNRQNQAGERRLFFWGQGLVEFAIVLPFLLVIGVVLLDLGRAYFTAITVANAAREGARYLTLHPDDLNNGFSGTKSAAVVDCPDTNADGRCDNGNLIYINPNNVVAYCLDNEPEPPSGPDGWCDNGSPARVSVTAIFRPLIPVLQFLGLPNTLTITRSAEMMVP